MEDLPFITSYTLLGFLILSVLVLAFCLRDYYFIYDHRLLFVIGLVFSRSLTYHAITDQIMWYLIDNITDDFVRSVVLANMQEFLSSLFVIFMAHSADSLVGRFRTLVFSTTAYIGGILILWIFDPYDVTWLMIVAIVLLGIGKSGDPILECVLKDLVDWIDTSTDRGKERSYARGAIWWCIPNAFGSIAAILWVAPFAFGGVQPTWKITFLICMISMTAALIIFFRGHNVYRQSELTHRPVEIFLRVFRAKLQNLYNSNSRCSTNTSAHERLPETISQGNEGITRFRSPLHLDTAGEKYRGSYSTYKDDIKIVRSLLMMFPLWGTLVVVSLTSAAGSTFYIEQFSNLRGNDKIPAQMFDIIHDVSGFVILILYSCTRFSQNVKLKIGVGMLCGFLSCVSARILESYRLKEGDKLSGLENTSISFMWLVPQFTILGCMEGLTEEGSLEFFKSQCEEPIRSYRDEYMEVVMCLGKLLNIFLIMIFHRWFVYDVNNGTRLDKYYLLLVCVSSVNFIIYCFIAKYFYKGTKPDLHLAEAHLQPHDITQATPLNKNRVNHFLVLLSRQASRVLEMIS